MYSVRIVYPNKPGSTFDWQHYYDVHLPWASASCVSIAAFHR